ncbi:MAG: putative DNA-binding mobile mystery protein A [Candidatus Azotimanducaceae bacterium]
MRLALGMSGTLLSPKLKGHRSTAAYLERAEQEGSITINKLLETAAAMGCDLIYGLVPKETARHTHPTIEDLLFDQADQKAKSAVRRANMQMALESQHLSEAAERHEVDRVRDTLFRTLPKDFWVSDPHTNRQE